MRSRPLQSVFTMAMICVICSLLLSLVYLASEPRAAAAAEAEAERARLAALPGASGFTLVEDAELVSGIDSVYKAAGSSGYVMTARARGYKKDIETVVGIDLDGRITGVVVTDVSGEIAGLGTRVALPAYTDQYRGAEAITADPGDPTAAYIESVGNAEEASTAVFSCVSNALLQFRQLSGSEELSSGGV